MLVKLFLNRNRISGDVFALRLQLHFRRNTFTLLRL